MDFLDFKEKVDRNGVTYYRMNPYMLHFISNTPLSRAYTTLGKMSDSERSWAAWAIDDLMGVKTKVFDIEQEKKRHIKNTVKKYLQQQNIKTGDVRAMELLYVPKEQRSNVDPAILELVKAFSKSGKALQ